MKNYKQLILFFFLFSSTLTFSQTDFKNGFIIDNNLERIDCEIKYFDWRNNPTSIEIRQNSNADTKKLTVNEISAFGINGESKYVRADVLIDQSTNLASQLSKQKEPEFIRDTVFLRELVKGKASLYYYEKGNTRKFFVEDGEKEIKQLIYKRYLVGNSIKINNDFQQRLYLDLNCMGKSGDYFSTIDYTKSSLVNFFRSYNECEQEDYSVEQGNSKLITTAYFSAGIKSTSLSISNPNSSSIGNSVDFGNQIGAVFGAELEFNLPFNNRKWSISASPAYTSFDKTGTRVSELLNGDRISLTERATYKSIEFPLGLKYYITKAAENDFYGRLNYVNDFLMGDPKIDFETSTDLRLNSSGSFEFGLGYQIKEKYQIELNLQPTKNLITGNSWNTDYSAFLVEFYYSPF